MFLQNIKMMDNSVIFNHSFTFTFSHITIKLKMRVLVISKAMQQSEYEGKNVIHAFPMDYRLEMSLNFCFLYFFNTIFF